MNPDKSVGRSVLKREENSASKVAGLFTRSLAFDAFSLSQVNKTSSFIFLIFFLFLNISFSVVLFETLRHDAGR